MADLRGAIGATEFFRREETTYARSSAYGFDLDVLGEQLRILRTEEFGFRVEEHPFVHPRETASYFRDLDYTRSIDRSCRTIESRAYVDPRGRLYPCLTIDMGNVFDRPFLEVWNGERFRSFRRLIRRRGRLALCHRCPDAWGNWDGGSAAAAGRRQRP
jgi:MoaA/NifB/PqqE/SkfB family radical SAM enzyme